MSNDKNGRAVIGSPKGFDPPNYTQTPNTLFDLMPTMSNQELRVTLAIIRKTKGWHKQEDELSLTQLQEVTGLSRQGVINGVKQALKRGTVYRKLSGRSYKYGLVVNDVDTPSDDQSTTLTNDSQPSRPTMVNDVDTQKKTKESKEKDSVANATGGEGDKPSSKKKDKEQLDAMYDAILEGSFGHLDDDLKRKVGGRVGQLRKYVVTAFPDHTADTIKQFYAYYSREVGVTAPRDLEKFKDHYVRFVQAMREGKAKGSNAPKPYVPKHVDVYVPPADVVNPVRRKETEA